MKFARKTVVLCAVALVLSTASCRSFTFGNNTGGMNGPSGQGSGTGTGNGPGGQGAGADADAYGTTPRCPGGTTCRLHFSTCGEIDDGCGGKMNCGGCADGNVCDAITNTCGLCLPQTCESSGKNCGVISDGCGGTIDCGAASGGCGENETCGGGGTANACGCTPRNCRELGKSCGLVPDGCGGQVDCDAQVGCSPEQECSMESNTCFFPNCEGYTDCTQIEAIVGHPLCGPYPDGCGGTLLCGQCAVGEICDRESNTCKAYPKLNPLDPDSAPVFGGSCTDADGCDDGFACVYIDMNGNGTLDTTVINVTINGVTHNLREVDGICRAEACGDRQCGGFTDACGVSQDCDAGATICRGGKQCVGNVCQDCQRITCAPRQCGVISDGCGGFIDCGSAAVNCDPTEVCHPDLKKCVDPVDRDCAQECMAQGKNCGNVRHWDQQAAGGAGAFVTCSCGACTGRESCGGSGYPGVCGLTAPDAECLRQGVECGEVTDACGNTFLCKGCGAGETCDFVPSGGKACRACNPEDYKTCADYPGQCGIPLDDNCGGTINPFCTCSGPNGEMYVCDDNPAGSRLGVCCAAGEEIAEPDDPFTEPTGSPAGSGNGTPGGFIVGSEPTIGDCCLPDPASLSCPRDTDGGGPAPIKQCGTFEDSCGVAYDCACPGGAVCDTNPGGGNLYTCCGAGEVIAQTRGEAGVKATGAASGGHTVGNCCAVTPGSDQCPPDACGTYEDSCGRNFNCSLCGPGERCDDLLAGNPANYNICCSTPTQVLRTADEGPVNNGFNANPPADPPMVGDCCEPDALTTTCWNGPSPSGTDVAYCRIREDNCGQNRNCPTLNGAAGAEGCPPGRFCAGDSTCCNAGLVVSDGDSGTANGAGAAPMAAGQCCTQEGQATTCRTGAGTTPPRRLCGTREDNCGKDLSCTCGAGEFCAQGNSGTIVDSMNNSDFSAANGTSGDNTVPANECCIDMTDAQACAGYACGQVETVCGRNVTCTNTCTATGCNAATNTCCPAPPPGYGSTYSGGACCLYPTGATEIAAACAAAAGGAGACNTNLTICGQPIACGNCPNPPGSAEATCIGNVCCQYDPATDPTCGNQCTGSINLSCGRGTVTCGCPPGGLCDTNGPGGADDQCCAALTPAEAAAGKDRIIIDSVTGDCCATDDALVAPGACPPGFCGVINGDCHRTRNCGCSGGVCDANGPDGPVCDSNPTGVAQCCAGGQVIATAGATNACVGDCCSENNCPAGTTPKTIAGGSWNAPICNSAFANGCGGTRNCGCSGGAVCNTNNTGTTTDDWCCPPGRAANGNGTDCVCTGGQVPNGPTACCTPPTPVSVCRPSGQPPRCGDIDVSCGPDIACGTTYCTEVGGSCDGMNCTCPSREELCLVKPYCNRQVNVNPCNNQVLNCNGCPGGGG